MKRYLKWVAGIYELVDDEVTVEALTRFAAQAADDVGPAI